MGADGLSATLDALSQAFPYPAYLFEHGGRLRWMSDEAPSASGWIPPGSARVAYRTVRGAGGATQARGGAGVRPVRRRGQGCASRVSCTTTSGCRPPFRGERDLAAAPCHHPAMAQLPGESLGAEALPRLGAVESRVARLARRVTRSSTSQPGSASPNPRAHPPSQGLREARRPRTRGTLLCAATGLHVGRSVVQRRHCRRTVFTSWISTRMAFSTRK